MDASDSAGEPPAVAYREAVGPEPCDGCKVPTRLRVVWRGRVRPCCGRLSCELWAASGINGELLPPAGWE